MQLVKDNDVREFGLMLYGVVVFSLHVKMHPLS